MGNFPSRNFHRNQTSVGVGVVIKNDRFIVSRRLGVWRCYRKCCIPLKSNALGYGEETVPVMRPGWDVNGSTIIGVGIIVNRLHFLGSTRTSTFNHLNSGWLNRGLAFAGYQGNQGK